MEFDMTFELNICSR